MKKTKIDILLPYWGEFGLLKKTVESVLAQTNNDWCLRIFDDCYPSTEASDYFSTIKDDRITYYRHEKNIGITDNFNYALASVTADYCMLIGCDDIMLPNYVDSALKGIGSADFYQPSVQIIDKNGTVYKPLVDKVKKLLQPKKSGYYGGEKLAASLCIGNWLYFPSIMWRSETIKRYGFNPRYKIAEDLLLELTIIKDGGALSYDKVVSFQYRRFADSLSSREKKKGGVRFNEEAEVYSLFATEFKRIGWTRAMWSARCRITSRLHQMLS